MRLGEAYVNVRADLKPYARDLQAGLKATTKAFEDQLNKDLGKRLGRSVSDGAREELVQGSKRIAEEVKGNLSGINLSFEKNVRDSSRRGARDGLKNGIWDGLRAGTGIATLIASALASALDDGISALPVQVKAAITGGLLLASPTIIAMLGAAVSAGIALGVGAGGIALASQLAPVQDAFTEAMEAVRTELAESAGPLIEPLLNGLDFFVSRVKSSIGPTLEDLFSGIAPGIEDLINGLTAGFEGFIDQITASGTNLSQILSDVGVVAAQLGAIFGKAFAILVSSGEDGRIALRDLTVLLEMTVLGVAVLVRLVTELYGRIRTIVNLIQGDFAGAASSILNRGVEDAQTGIFNLGNGYGGLTVATDAQTKAFQDQQKAIEDAKKAMDDLVKAESDLISNRIDSAESWDRLKEGIKDGGTTLKLTEEEGRTNARNIQKYLEDVRTELQGLVDDGKITAQEAETQFARQAAAAETLFGKTREGKAAFRDLFGEFIQLAKFRFDPSPWIAAFNKIGSAVQTAINRIKELQVQAAKAGLSTDIKVTGGTQLMADGGRVTQPTSAILGENYRSEVVLPETKPQRAAEILSSSPLAGFLGGGQTTVFAWFDGEPFQARITRTARGVSKQNARTLANVPRSI